MTYRGSGQAFPNQQGPGTPLQPSQQQQLQYMPASPDPFYAQQTPTQPQPQPQYFQGEQQYLTPQYGVGPYGFENGFGSGAHQMQAQQQYVPPAGVWQQAMPQQAMQVQQQDYAFQQALRQQQQQQHQQQQQQHQQQQQQQQLYQRHVASPQMQQQPQVHVPPRTPSLPQTPVYVPPASPVQTQVNQPSPISQQRHLQSPQLQRRRQLPPQQHVQQPVRRTSVQLPSTQLPPLQQPIQQPVQQPIQEQYVEQQAVHQQQQHPQELQEQSHQEQIHRQQPRQEQTSRGQLLPQLHPQRPLHQQQIHQQQPHQQQPHQPQPHQQQRHHQPVHQQPVHQPEHRQENHFQQFPRQQQLGHQENHQEQYSQRRHSQQQHQEPLQELQPRDHHPQQHPRQLHPQEHPQEHPQQHTPQQRPPKEKPHWQQHPQEHHRQEQFPQEQHPQQRPPHEQLLQQQQQQQQQQDQDQPPQEAPRQQQFNHQEHRPEHNQQLPHEERHPQQDPAQEHFHQQHDAQQQDQPLHHRPQQELLEQLPVEEVPLPTPTHHEPEQQHAFVNLQDIQQLPPLKTVSIGQPQSIQTPTPILDDTIYTSQLQVKQEFNTVNPLDTMVNFPPPPQPQQHPQKIGTPRIRASPHSSVSNSPALTTRSPSISKKSPAIPAKPRPYNTIPLMCAIAEECFDKARASVHDVAMSLHPTRVDEYEKLISTGLACLEAAIYSDRLSPRPEARVRLRYAAILLEETENLMEAETTLTKGITICEKHRMYDLKYCTRYVMLKVLFQRNRKASHNATDRQIADCEAFKHVHWIYAFRLLKATFYMEGRQMASASSLENIRLIQNLANSRGDNAISALASVLEGLALLKASRDGNLERVQACIAQVAKFQFDPSVRILQLDVLSLLLDLASSINHQPIDLTTQKLRALQNKLDDSGGWNNVRSDFLLPIKKEPLTSITMSDDTTAIIRAGDANSPNDFLVLSFMTKMELMSLVFTCSGLANYHKSSSNGRRSAEYWREGLKILESWDSTTLGIPYGPPVSLQEAVRQREWRIEAQAYLHVILGLAAASSCQWTTVKEHMTRLENLITPSTQSILRLLVLYLSGVYQQGTGNLAAAHSIFQDATFSLAQSGASIKAAHREVSLLANLNRLWIMQHPSHRDDRETMDLIEQLEPMCSNHPNIDLRTAWHNVLAAMVTDPPQQLNQMKQHIQAAMAGSRVTTNVLGSAVTLSIMRNRLFENVIGEQALKSALAAAKQAQKSGNLLWQSVTDGMLAQSREVQGQREQARQEWEKATREANEAFAGSS